MLQAYRYVRGIDPRRDDVLLEMLYGHDHRRLTVEGHPARHHLIHHDTQRIDITLRIAVAASGLLRGGIVYRAHGICRIRIRRDRFRDAEIRHLYLAVPGDDDILGLDIPMYDLIVVSHLQTGCHLNGDTGGLLDGQTTLFLDIGLEGDALYQLHDDIEDILLITDIIDIDDIRMSQPCCSLSLLLKFADEILILHEFILQHLYRHKAVQLMILSLEDLRHAAGSDFFQNLIAVS